MEQKCLNGQYLQSMNAEGTCETTVTSVLLALLSRILKALALMDTDFNEGFPLTGVLC